MAPSAPVAGWTARRSDSEAVELRRILYQYGLALRCIRSPQGKLVEHPAIVDRAERCDVGDLAASHLRRVWVWPVSRPQHALRIRGDQRLGQLRDIWIVRRLCRCQVRCRDFDVRLARSNEIQQSREADLLQ